MEAPLRTSLGRAVWKNHKEYEQGVTGAADELVADGVLTKDQRKAILRQAKQSGCGRRF